MTLPLISTREAADLLGLTNGASVLKLIDRFNAGKPEAMRVKTYRLGVKGRVRIDRQSLLAMLIRREAIEESR